MGAHRSSTTPKYGTLAPMPLWALGAKVPTIAAVIGILWSADYPQGEWAFLALLLGCCVALTRGLMLLPLLIVGGLMARANRPRMPFGPQTVFRPTVDPGTSPVSMEEAVQARKVGAVLGGFGSRVVTWSIAIFSVTYIAPLLTLPRLDLSVAVFTIAAFCLVLSAVLVSLGTSTLALFLDKSRGQRLWRQLFATHILQFMGMVDWPIDMEHRSARKQNA